MGKRILLIEDEPHIAEAIRYILERDGWSVATHANGADAMETIRREAPEVLVLDVMLPVRSGYEILADLRADAALAGLPVLVLSARGQDSERSRAEAAGASRFLSKPFANEAILAILREMTAT